MEEESRTEPEPKRTRVSRYQDENKEAEVGIRVFLGQTPPFTGVLKQRYQDFLVNEIEPNGKIAHLTDITTLPPISEKEEDVKKEGASAPSLSQLISEKEAQELAEFASSPEQTKVFQFQPISDKELRTNIHKAISIHYPHLYSSTQDGKVTVYFKSNKQFTQRGRHEANRWPKNRPDYLHFVLYKENKETGEALNLLSHFLGVQYKSFSFAGTKDKRGVTVQKVSLFRVDAEKAAKLNPRLYGIKIGNFSYAPEYLKLGDLLGNRFTIVIRNVEASDETITNAISDLQKFGFINYFGLQRFGTGSVSTHEVGIQLLLSNYQKASELLLFPREGESEDATKARQLFHQTGNIEETLKIMPHRLSVERNLLKGMQKHGKGQFLNAFSMIPRPSRTLYVHSYQSFIWNHMASERLELYGHSDPVIGDLVVVQGDVSSLPNEDELSEEPQERRTKDVQVKIVDEQDIGSGKYTIFDVVLPLPGHSVLFPTHKIGNRYIELLAKDGITLETLKHTNKDFSLAGSYRRIIERAKDLTWEIVRYDNPNVPLIQTDLEILEKKEPPALLPDAKFRALKLSFSLTSSCYATMCFRQLLKSSTSIAHHVALSQEADQQE